MVCHTVTAAPSQSTPGSVQKGSDGGGLSMPAGKSHWTIVRNWVCGVSAERKMRQMSKSYGTDPGVAQSSASP